MTASKAGAKADCLPRQSDRRIGFGEMLASLAKTLDTRSEPTLMRITSNGVVDIGWNQICDHI